MLRWLMTVVVSDEEKAHVDASGGDQEGERERTAEDASKQLGGIETGEYMSLRDEPGGYPYCWPGGARREGGVSLVCCACMERGKASVDTACPR
jgi:hypothetical protein